MIKCYFTKMILSSQESEVQSGVQKLASKYIFKKATKYMQIFKHKMLKAMEDENNKWRSQKEDDVFGSPFSVKAFYGKMFSSAANLTIIFFFLQKILHPFRFKARKNIIPRQSIFPRIKFWHIVPCQMHIENRDALTWLLWAAVKNLPTNVFCTNQ